MAKDLSQLEHYLANTPLHFYYDKKEDGTQVLRHIRVQQRKFEVPADGITIDTLPANSVGTEQIKDEGVQMQDLSREVKDRINASEVELEESTDPMSLLS